MSSELLTADQFAKLDQKIAPLMAKAGLAKAKQQPSGTFPGYAVMFADPKGPRREGQILAVPVVIRLQDVAVADDIGELDTLVRHTAETAIRTYQEMVSRVKASGEANSKAKRK